GGSQETSASAARRAAQSVARTGARRGARRARRQGHVEGAQSRGAVAANRGPFRNFPAGRLRKGQNLDPAVALLSVALRRRSTQPTPHMIANSLLRRSGTSILPGEWVMQNLGVTVAPTDCGRTPHAPTTPISSP